MNGQALEYVRLFVAVVDNGGFAPAARKLDRAQSVVTYGVQKLEEQLGLDLFDRSGYRPTLTLAGQALLPRARRLLEETSAFDAMARGIAGGLEAEVALVVDPLFPMAPLVMQLRDFEQLYPSVQARVFAEPLGTATSMVLEGKVDLGLLIYSEERAAELEQSHLLPIELVLVAAPSHPLAQIPAPIPLERAREELQLVLSERSDFSRGIDRGVLSTRTWRLSDLGAKHALLRAGLGWGSMPRHMVQDDLDRGDLVQLPLDYWEGDGSLPRVPTVAAHRKDRALGPAALWLLERLKRQVPQCAKAGHI